MFVHLAIHENDAAMAETETLDPTVSLRPYADEGSLYYIKIAKELKPFTRLQTLKACTKADYS